MRFLILTQYYAPEIGAPQVRFASFLKELRKQGHEVEVVTAMPNHPTGRIFPAYRGRWYLKEEVGGIPVHRVWIYASLGAGVKRLLNYLSFTVTSLWGLFKAKKPDILFVESPPLFLGLTAYFYSRIFRVPFIFNVADLWPDSIRELDLMSDGFTFKALTRLESWIYKKSAYVNAVTDGIRDALLTKKAVPAPKVLFLPNGIDTELFYPGPGEPQLLSELGLANKKLVLYAGTLGLAQGLDVVLEAAKRIQDQKILPEIGFCFVGDGSDKARLVTLSKDLKLGNVFFLDPCPPETVARLFRSSWLGIACLKDIPLFHGARPSKLLPIMASGRPVIYVGVGEGARLIKEAQAGLSVQPGQPDKLVEAVITLSQDSAMYEQMAVHGREFISSHLSWRAVTKEWLEELEA